MSVRTRRVQRARLIPLVAGAGWVAVFAVASATGNRFDSETFTGLWQLLPIEDLRTNPLGSVWNLHIQPPVWNLVIGVLARWSPLSQRTSLELLMVAAGFAATVLLCDVLRHMGLRWRWALSLTLFVMCAPDVLVNAFEPRYELAITALLVAMAWIVVRGAAADERSPWLVALAAVGTIVTMTRTLYHPLWLVLIVGLFAWRWRGTVTRRGLLVSALVPAIVVGGWMLKNQVLFGRFTLSTWDGMNLQRAAVTELRADEKAGMVARGDLSEVSAAGPFGKYDLYIPAVGPCRSTSSSPVLRKVEREGAFATPNFNGECYLPVFDLARDDAFAAIRAYPNRYVEGRLWSARRWFALDDTFAHSRSRPVRALHDVYRIVEVGIPGTLQVSNFGTPIFGTADVPNDFSLLLVVCTVAVVVAGWRRRRHGRAGDLSVFVAVLTAWTFATGVLFELGEQPRFRSMVDPLVVAVGLVVLVRSVRALVRSDGPSETVEQS